MPRFYRRRRFGGGGGRQRTAVTRSDIPMPKTKSKRKCAACKGTLTMGEAVIRLRLKKSHQHPCASCGHKPAKLKYFHASCDPGDVNKAMGYDPAAHAAATGQHHSAPSGGAVPPPPKPPTATESLIMSLASLEGALKLKLRDTPSAWHVVNGKRVLKPEIEKEFTTFQGIKARVLRGSTDGEVHAATSIGLQRVIKMIFNL